jgi:predicted DNA-binding ribbon-helix-helix protein
MKDFDALAFIKTNPRPKDFHIDRRAVAQHGARGSSRLEAHQVGIIAKRGMALSS